MITRVRRRLAAATRTLSLLNAQADELRAELSRLRQRVLSAQRELTAPPAAELLSANEQLILAALHAETAAESALTNFNELARKSQRDPLTDTPNRALMLDRIATAIAMARRHGGRSALLFLDLDHFKEINDVLGHPVGDDVVKLVARRLESVVRKTDTVSRHGGDEFLVLLAEVLQASDAAVVAAKILSALDEPNHVGEHVFRLSASIGIAIYPDDGDTAESLIRHADAAMYHSKKIGRGTFQFHAVSSGDDTEQPERPARVATHSEFPPELRPADLREANERLVIAALVSQEQEANADYAQRQQVRFLAMVAHELRNPLAPIRTAAELIGRSVENEPLLTRLQAMIERQVTHLSRLVDDLLDGSSVSSGNFQLDRSTVDIPGVLRLAAETSRPAIERRLQNLSLRIPPVSFGVEGDAVRLAQVFCNLLDNASKYTPEGGEIALAMVVKDSATEITVSDNGIGIASDALPTIFDLFVQGPRSLVAQTSGLGIGLAVVRELVEAHGGTVVGTSAGRNLGSEFVVTLPMTSEVNLSLDAVRAMGPSH